MTKDKELCSVVIPVFNKAASVERSIKSVMEQTLNNLECFVVDNNSTDGTVVKRLSSLGPPSKAQLVG